MSACVFRTRESIKEAIGAIRASRTYITDAGEVRESCREYKYARSKRAHKNAFFAAIQDLDFSVRAIVVDKRKIRSGRLRNHPEGMKHFMIEQLLTHTFGTVSDATVVIDGQDARPFSIPTSSSLTTRVNMQTPGVIARVSFVDSKENELIQLADMTAGAVRKMSAGDRDALSDFGAFRSKSFQPNGSLWHFR